nr:glycosyltransferase [Lysobacter spongiae]
MYLSRELAAQGAEVHVLTPEGMPGSGPRLAVPQGISVHRTFPGVVTGGVRLVSRLSALRKAKRGPGRGVTASEGEASGLASIAEASSVLNWKGRLIETISRVAARWWFPDARGEWRFFARQRLLSLLHAIDPHVVISSHEPATTLQLGMMAKTLGFPWLVDLGDPVLAEYTPRRWRRRSLRLERMTCERADAITVTTDGTRRLLVERHDVDAARVQVMTQGFDPAIGVDPCVAVFQPEFLELLFTGSFYAFRRPESLVDAVIAAPGVRLNIATSRVPASLEIRIAQHPDRIRLLGYLPHETVRALQRNADVLVNIANDNPEQVPGKVFEYLGAGRPILHLEAAAKDEAGLLIEAKRRGLRCAMDSSEIQVALAQLARLKHEGAFDAAFDLSEESVQEFSWTHIGRILGRRLALLVGGKCI